MKLLEAIKNATKSDLDEIDKQIASHQSQLKSLQAARKIIAAAVGEPSGNGSGGVSVTAIHDALAEIGKPAKAGEVAAKVGMTAIACGKAMTASSWFRQLEDKRYVIASTGERQ